jgi:hypothetical protein
MKTQKDFVKAWAKMELNSSYGFPPVSVISTMYDENKVPQITEEGKNRLWIIQEMLKTVLYLS